MKVSTVGSGYVEKIVERCFAGIEQAVDDILDQFFEQAGAGGLLNLTCCKSLNH